jgi:hypothetical protein
MPLGTGQLTADIAAADIVIQPETADTEREFGAVIEACFSQTPATFIRTNDALHLASAKVAGEPEFIRADMRQRAAAMLMGFAFVLTGTTRGEEAASIFKQLFWTGGHPHQLSKCLTHCSSARRQEVGGFQLLYSHRTGNLGVLPGYPQRESAIGPGSSGTIEWRSWSRWTLRRPNGSTSDSDFARTTPSGSRDRILSHGAGFVMHQGVRAALRSGENFQVPAIIADTDPGFNGLAQSPEASDYSFN